eukprot:3675896-Amphidinium_carterae.1
MAGPPSLLLDWSWWKVDAHTVQPNDFALLVEGLPVTATDETQLASWFQDNLIKGKKVDNSSSCD